MTPTRLAVPEWLTRILRDKSAGPRIYRWTADDVARSKAASSRHSPSSEERDPASGSSTKTVSVRSAEDAKRRIYILGVGNLGRLFAASLARLHDRPPITLVVHRPSLLEHWRAKPGLILHPPTYLEGGRNAENGSRIVDFDVEMWSEKPPPVYQQGGDSKTHSDADTAASAEIGHVSNLVVATKAQHALPTVDWLRRYLGAGSTVAFAQNGMNRLWPPYGAIYNASRYAGTPPIATEAATARQSPLWLSCVVTHGVFSLGPFESVHASPAGMVFGAVSAEDSPALEGPNDRQPYLARQLLASSQLSARLVPRPELWMLQVEKLVINSVINPLTAILRCKNGDLFDTEDMSSGERGSAILPKIIDQLLREASTVLQALALLETGSGGVLEQTAAFVCSNRVLIDRLSFESLRSVVYRVGDVVKDNTSSMLQDVLAEKPTEVSEFNGWIVEMARYLKSVDYAKNKHLDVTSHQTIIGLVEEGAHFSRDQLGRYFVS